MKIIEKTEVKMSLEKATEILNENGFIAYLDDDYEYGYSITFTKNGISSAFDYFVIEDIEKYTTDMLIKEANYNIDANIDSLKYDLEAKKSDHDEFA